MKRRIFKTIVTIVLVLVFAGCGDKNVSEAQTNMPTPEITATVTPEPTKKMDSFTLDEIHEEGYLTPEEQAAADEKAKDTQFLLDAIENLSIGFNTYGIDFEIDGKNAYVHHPDSEGIIWKLCANNSYLEAHNFKFNIPEGSSITRYTPKTFESLGFGYVENDPDTWVSIGECHGYVWESQLDSVTGIQWEDELVIVIDELYRIYINYNNTDISAGDGYFTIH